MGSNIYDPPRVKERIVNRPPQMGNLIGSLSPAQLYGTKTGGSIENDKYQLFLEAEWAVFMVPSDGLHKLFVTV